MLAGGRTGLGGRGDYFQWGPNRTVDPIVTRYDPDNPKQLHVLCKWRSQDACWSLPGTFLQKNETNDAAIRRALDKDVVQQLTNKSAGMQHIARLFHSGNVIYQGYVDDPRSKRTLQHVEDTTCFRSSRAARLHRHGQRVGRDCGGALPLQLTAWAIALPA